MIALVRGFARVIMAMCGRRHRSPFLHSLVFGTLNKFNVYGGMRHEILNEKISSPGLKRTDLQT